MSAAFDDGKPLPLRVVAALADEHDMQQLVEGFARIIDYWGASRAASVAVGVLQPAHDVVAVSSFVAVAEESMAVRSDAE